MQAVNIYTNTDQPIGTFSVTYSTNAVSSVQLVQLSNDYVTHIDSRNKLEDVLPTAKALAVEVSGSTKDFMEWLDTP